VTALEGMEASPALVVLRAVGTARRRGPREKPCGSWLGRAPHPQQSGGRGTSRAPRPGRPRAAQAWRRAAQTLQRRPSAWGACCRRSAARRGGAQAITATAYPLARIVSAMRKPGMASVAQGLAAEATASRERVGRPGKRQAAALGLMVGERDAGAPPSSGASGAAGGRQGPATDEAATAPSAITGGGCSWEGWGTTRPSTPTPWLFSLTHVPPPLADPLHQSIG
jgi:hypothetical protein